MDKQEAREAVQRFLDWGVKLKRPVVLAQKNKGILGEVPLAVVDELLDAWSAPEEKETDASDAPPENETATDEVAGDADAPGAQQPHVAPQRLTDEVPPHPPGSSVPPREM